MERNIQKHWQQLVAELKQVRKDQKISQKRLAAITGISTQTISRLEQGQEDIQVSTILKILDAFGMSLAIRSNT
jgi:transcriptional regulator with XRE-family HTH domain